MSTDCLTVRHSRGSYPVQFAASNLLAEHLPPHSFVITDKNVWSHWAHRFPDGTKAYQLDPGEASKCLAAFEDVVRWLARSGAKRDATVVAFGGGVVGDLAGYAAASYMRGVSLYQVPTTLLAQVDSSVGGKVGIDIPEGKNLVGAFCPPVKVFVATNFLSTLPEREFLNGAAEIWKTAAILDEDLFGILEKGELTPSSDILGEIITRCVKWKASVVETDEFETTGLRAILNFGHTIGHAIEQAMHYDGILHGEAVAIGMVIEARIGEKLGITPQGCETRLRLALSKFGLPTELPVGLPVDELLSAMGKDKKSVGATGDLAFSLLLGIGKCKLYTSIARESVREALVNS